MNNNGRLAQFKSEYGRTPTREELLDYIRNQKQDNIDQYTDKTIAMAKTKIDDGTRMEKPFYETEPSNPISNFYDTVNSIDDARLASYTPKLDLDNKKTIASLDDTADIDYNPTPATEEAKPIQSSTAKSIKLAANRPTSVSPVVSPESQAAGIGEKPAPTDYTQDPEMQAAQEEAFRRNQAALMLEAGRQISQGLGGLGSGQEVKLDNQTIKGMIDKSNVPVEQLTTSRDALMKRLALFSEAEKHSGTSGVSLMTQKLAMQMGKELGMGVAELSQFKGKSFSELEPIMSNLKDMAHYNIQKDMKNAQIEANRIAKQTAAKSKAETVDSKELEAFRKAYDPQIASSRSVLGKEASRYVQSQHAMNLIGEVKDLNDITPMQKRELAVALATMLSPGIPHESTINHLDEATLNSRLAEYIQKVTGAPAGTNTKGLTAQLKKSVMNQQKVSAANIKKSQDAVKAVYNKQIAKNPEYYNQIMKSIDLENGTEEVQPSGMVHMVDANGTKEYDVPADKVEQAKANGWKVK